MTFSTSLSRISQAQAKADDNDAASAVMAYGGRPILKAPPKPAARYNDGVDVWVEAHFSQYRADVAGNDDRGTFGIVYVGADVLATSSLLVGVLAQFDWMSEKARSQTLAATPPPDATVSGRGAMAGPYISGRISQNLFFDARVAWGASDNRINPFGQYEDQFTTGRWLARGNLTGNWNSGNVRITPSAGVTYVQENQRAYFDSLGVFIPGQTVALGRFDAGPEFAYRYFGVDGTTYEPHVSIKGIWDFQRPDVPVVAGLRVAGEQFHARTEAGLLARAPSGFSVRGVVTYDGVGSRNFRDVGGQLWVNIPLR